MDTALGLTTNQSTTYTITQVDNLFAQKHPLITAFTNLTVYKLSHQIWEPPTGLTDVFIKSPQVSFLEVAVRIQYWDHYLNSTQTLCFFIIPFSFGMDFKQ